MTTGGSVRRTGWGMLLGGAVSLAGAAAHWGGVWSSIDDAGLDLHFRHFSSIRPDPRIVLVDIDDHALHAVGAWPWPRRYHADLVLTLKELGASHVVLDIVLSEPTPPRVEVAPTHPFEPGGSELSVLGDPSETPLVFDDVELAEAIQKAGNVYLPLFFEMDEPSARMVADGAQIAARQFLERHPDGQWRDFFVHIRPDHHPDHVSPDRKELELAFRAAQAERAVTASCPRVPDSVDGQIAHARNVTPPLAEFVRAAQGVGFVSFRRAGSAAIVRGLPLVAELDGAMVPQLAFLVALDGLGIPRAEVHFGGGLSAGDGPAARRLPLDPRGESLVHWHCPPQREQWSSSFEHIPVARVLEIPFHRRAIAENQKRLEIRIGELVKLRHAETPGEFAEYASLIRQRRHLMMNGTWTAVANKTDWEPPYDDLPERIMGIEVEACEWLHWKWKLWENETPQTPAEAEEKSRIRAMYEDFAESRLARELTRFDFVMVSRIDELRRDLAPRIQGKTVLVGYTASAVADVVPTPVHPAMPGVMAHANILNMLMQGRPVWRASAAANTVWIVLGGIIISLITSMRGPLASLAAVSILWALGAASGAMVFHYHGVYAATPSAGLTMAAAWAAVTIHRQLTAERSRRRFQRALTQYTSPAVAARIAESRDDAALAPRAARVSCFFADLADFTPMSERLGAERTREVLNPYLSEMSRVLIVHGALVNKFMGDGIFAFFNAPIWPCEQHAEASCRSALAALNALEGLNRTVPAIIENGPLTMRIGLTTGEAFVGDYGSASKLDYTCIGDTVNLASRLERANRALGTRILVDEQTRLCAGDSFRFRRLGLFEIPGKREPIELFELMNSAKADDAEMAAFIARFEQAVLHFHRGEWEPCLDHLRQLERLRPDDRPSRIYSEEANRRRTEPPSSLVGRLPLKLGMPM